MKMVGELTHYGGVAFVAMPRAGSLALTLCNSRLRIPGGRNGLYLCELEARGMDSSYPAQALLALERTE